MQNLAVGESSQEIVQFDKVENCWMKKKWTTDELRRMTEEIDSLVICAGSMHEMYLKLKRLRKNGDEDWQLLHSPWRARGHLIAVVIRPAKG